MITSICLLPEIEETLNRTQPQEDSTASVQPSPTVTDVTKSMTSSVVMNEESVYATTTPVEISPSSTSLTAAETHTSMFTGTV